MSYDCELTGNLAQWNEEKEKRPEQETNVNQSFPETDDKILQNRTEQNERTCADRLQMQYTYSFLKPVKYMTEIIQSMLVTYKERMHIKMFVSVCGRARLQAMSLWQH